ncbi:MAG: hypothetical protein KC609_22880, partial [Myxococcales bacterium]|nr:hypothetical protein [Myxococcales bacterium]
MTRDKRSSEIGKVKTARLSGVKPPDRTMELDIDDLSIDEMAGLADETPKRPSGRPLPPPPPAPSKGARPSAPPAKRPVVQTALRTPEKAAPPAKRDEPTSSDDPKAASAPGALTPSGGATKRPAGSRPAPPVLDAASTGSSATAVAGTQAKSAAARGNASPTPEGSAKSAAPASPEPTRKPFPTALNDTTKKPATST